jgi:hypothetical protein
MVIREAIDMLAFSRCRKKALCLLNQSPDGVQVYTPDGCQRFLLAPGVPEVQYDGTRAIVFGVILDHSRYAYEIRKTMTLCLQSHCIACVSNPQFYSSKRCNVEDRLKKIAKLLVPEDPVSLTKSTRWHALVDECKDARSKFKRDQEMVNVTLLGLIVEAVVDILVGRWAQLGVAPCEKTHHTLDTHVVINEIQNILVSMEVTALITKQVIASAHDNRSMLAYRLDDDNVLVDHPLLIPLTQAFCKSTVGTDMLELSVPITDVPDIPGADVPDVPGADVPFVDVPATSVPFTAVLVADVSTSDVPTTDVHMTELPMADVPKPESEFQQQQQQEQQQQQQQQGKYVNTDQVLNEVKAMYQIGHKIMSNAAHLNMMADQLKTQAKSDYGLAQQMMDHIGCIKLSLSNQRSDTGNLLQQACDMGDEPNLKRQCTDAERQLLTMSLPDLIASLPSQTPSHKSSSTPTHFDPELLPSRDPSISFAPSDSAFEFFNGIAHASIVETLLPSSY